MTQGRLEIRRFGLGIGADCMDCDWQEFGAEARQAAMRHARQRAHKVHVVMEETTVYNGHGFGEV